MAASIVSQTYALELNPDKILTLGNEEYIRTFNFGSSWSKIRLGLCYSVHYQTVSIGGLTWVLGVCSGKTNGFAAGTTTNFVGVNLTSNSAISGTLSANYGPPWFITTAGTVAVKRVGGTNTFGTGSATTLYGNNTDTSLRNLLFVDITKGSPNYTLSVYQYSNYYSNPYLTTTVFNAAMNSITSPPSSCVVQLNAGTIACDESAGGFDSFNLFYNSSANWLDVGSIGATRLIA